MLGQVQEVPGNQCRLITFTAGLAILDTVPFEGALAEQFAALFVSEVTGVTVVFEVRLRSGLVWASIGQRLATGHLKVVIAQCAACNTGLQADMEGVAEARPCPRSVASGAV